MISVIDYGVTNIGSLLNMLRKCGIAARAVTAPDDVRAAEKLVLPGVGSFDNGASHLRDRGLVEPIRESVTKGTPILGICLGMQLLAEGSEEGTIPGLGLIRGRSVRFRLPPDSSLKIPHLGWKQPSLRRQSRLLTITDPRTRFYFTHSFHVVCDEPGDVVATAHYGVEFTAMIERDHVCGVQYHPEKSHSYGMAILKNYAAL